MNALTYRVSTFRAAGLEARWGRNRKGAPRIYARDPDSKLRHQRDTWWEVTPNMFENMKTDGVRLAFAGFTLIGDLFWIPS